MKKILAVAFSFMFLGLVGCGGKGKISQDLQVKQTIIETIPRGDMPKWASNGIGYYKKDGKMFYSEVAEGYTNIEASRRAAFAAAQTKVAEQIKNTIGVEFARSMEAGAYEETTGGYLKNVFMSNVNKLQVSGIVVEENYSEKIQEVSGYDSKVFWRTYTLVSIPEKTYNDLVKRAFTDTSAQVAQNKSAKELLQEAEKRFYADANAAVAASEAAAQ